MSSRRPYTRGMRGGRIAREHGNFVNGVKSNPESSRSSHPLNNSTLDHGFCNNDFQNAGCNFKEIYLLCYGLLGNVVSVKTSDVCLEGVLKTVSDIGDLCLTTVVVFDNAGKVINMHEQAVVKKDSVLCLNIKEENISVEKIEDNVKSTGKNEDTSLQNFNDSESSLRNSASDDLVPFYGGVHSSDLTSEELLDLEKDAAKYKEGQCFTPEEMIQVNKEKFGVETSFKEDLQGYTVPLDRSAADFKDKLTKAEQLADCIEKDVTRFDEEALEKLHGCEKAFSSVVRQENNCVKDELQNKTLAVVDKDSTTNASLSKAPTSSNFSEKRLNDYSAERPTCSLDVSKAEKKSNQVKASRPSYAAAVGGTGSETNVKTSTNSLLSTSKEIILSSIDFNPAAPEFKPRNSFHALADSININSIVSSASYTVSLSDFQHGQNMNSVGIVGNSAGIDEASTNAQMTSASVNSHLSTTQDRQSSDIASTSGSSRVKAERLLEKKTRKIMQTVHVGNVLEASDSTSSLRPEENAARQSREYVDTKKRYQSTDAVSSITNQISNVSLVSNPERCNRFSRNHSESTFVPVANAGLINVHCPRHSNQIMPSVMPYAAFPAPFVSQPDPATTNLFQQNMLQMNGQMVPQVNSLSPMDLQYSNQAQVVTGLPQQSLQQDCTMTALVPSAIPGYFYTVQVQVAPAAAVQATFAQPQPEATPHNLILNSPQYTPQLLYCLPNQTAQPNQLVATNIMTSTDVAYDQNTQFDQQQHHQQMAATVQPQANIQGESTNVISSISNDIPAVCTVEDQTISSTSETVLVSETNQDDSNEPTTPN